MKRFIPKLIKMVGIIDWEALVWTIGLLILALSDPHAKSHYTLFVPDLLFGIKSPGYNLGHSISYFFHGDIYRSIQIHWFGTPTVLILTYRVLYLIFRKFQNKKLMKELRYG